MYYYIPQHSWGLVENPNNEGVHGFYSGQGGPCRPVALWCNTTNRGAFAHWDIPNLVTQNLINWLKNYTDGNQIDVYTTEDNMQEVMNSIQVFTQNVANAGFTEPATWGFTFAEVRAPIEVADIENDDKTDVPDIWSDYWDGAPDWQNGSTFTAEFIPAVDGFFANYNGRYYFDFGH